MSCIIVSDQILAHIARSTTRLWLLGAEPLARSGRVIAAVLRQANIEAYRERYRCAPPPEGSRTIAFSGSAGIHVRVENGRPLVDPNDVGRLHSLLDFFEHQACDWSDWPSSEAKAIVDEVRIRLDRSLPGYQSIPGGCQFAVGDLSPSRYLLPTALLAHIAISSARLDCANAPFQHSDPPLSVGKIARILAVANARSVHARCADPEPPLTPISLFPRHCMGGIAVATSPHGPLCSPTEAGHLLSLLDHYESQSSDSPGWASSQAAAITRATRKLLRASLHGARFAAWGQLEASEAIPHYCLETLGGVVATGLKIRSTHQESIQ